MRIDKKLGRRSPRDLELKSSYWLVSDRMKGVLETTDPGGCAFVKCDVRMADGRPGPDFWLCDVVRVLDALDEQASRLTISNDPGQQRYDLAGQINLVFNEEVVGAAHIFRMAHAEMTIICDQQVKDACKAAGLSRMRFRDAAGH